MTRLALPVVLLLLLFSLTIASRKVPVDPSDSVLKTQQEAGVEMTTDVDKGCEGSAVEEYCLMQKSLVAHIDYIYGQSNKNP